MNKNNIFCTFFLILFSSIALAQTPAEPTPAATPPSENYKLTIDKVDPSRFYEIAVIQGLNKTTAKTSILEIRIGNKIKFGQLTMIAHKCWQASLDQKPESKILLEVFENKNDENGVSIEKRIFYGWMFASSPSISGLEHPIYDLTAISCKNK
jgi:hypothetical protein